MYGLACENAFGIRAMDASVLEPVTGIQLIGGTMPQSILLEIVVSHT